MILETTVLIDLEREAGRGAEGPAHRLLERHGTDDLYITFTIAGELAAGTLPERRQAWEEFVAPFQILSCNREVSWRYGTTYRFLKSNGLLIGSNDLWIAATALAHGMGVATSNVRHYRRVPGLSVLTYET